MKKLRICILGITGSIGSQTATICKKLGFKIVGCSYHTKPNLAFKLIRKHKIKYVLNTTKCLKYEKLINYCKPDVVVNAIVGFAGLKATIAALKCKKTLALANKESVVVAGKFIFSYAKQHKIKVIPVDSEHTSLYYQLMNLDTSKVNQIYITGSGGKLLNCSQSELNKITYKQALTHSNWVMGNKITIDSGTLVNKCFEVIEAYWYFQTKRINVLWDKTSTTHCGVLMNDGSFYYVSGKSTMTLPITWAINGFKAPTSFIKKDYCQAKQNVLMTINNIKPISFAYQVINDKTNSLGIIINAADEIALDLFKKGKLKFIQIVPFIEKMLKKIPRKTIKNFDQVEQFDHAIRKLIRKNI